MSFVASVHSNGFVSTDNTHQVYNRSKLIDSGVFCEKILTNQY